MGASPPPDREGIVRGEVRALRDVPPRQWVRIALLFAALLLPLWLLLELADEVWEGEPLPFDQPILAFAQSVSHEALDRLFLFFSAIGHEWGVVPFDVLLVVGLAFARRFRESIYAAVALGGSALLNLGAKQLFARARPTIWESIAPETTFSFPSGHAMGSMTLAVVVVALAWRSRRRAWFLAAMAVFVPMVGLSRVYLGVHYPSDILAGWSVALVWGLGVWLAFFGADGTRERGRGPA